jgi:hypothetical protein
MKTWTKALDQQVMAAMTGRQKLDALLTDRGYPTARSVAVELGEDETSVSRCLAGRTRPRTPTMARIRDGLARLAGLDRSAVDALLGPMEGV